MAQPAVREELSRQIKRCKEQLQVWKKNPPRTRFAVALVAAEVEMAEKLYYNTEGDEGRMKDLIRKMGSYDFKNA